MPIQQMCSSLFHRLKTHPHFNSILTLQKSGLRYLVLCISPAPAQLMKSSRSVHASRLIAEFDNNPQQHSKTSSRVRDGQYAASRFDSQMLTDHGTSSGSIATPPQALQLLSSQASLILRSSGGDKSPLSSPDPFTPGATQSFLHMGISGGDQNLSCAPPEIPRVTAAIGGFKHTHASRFGCNSPTDDEDEQKARRKQTPNIVIGKNVDGINSDTHRGGAEDSDGRRLRESVSSQWSINKSAKSDLAAKGFSIKNTAMSSEMIMPITIQSQLADQNTIASASDAEFTHSAQRRTAYLDATTDINKHQTHNSSVNSDQSPQAVPSPSVLQAHPPPTLTAVPVGSSTNFPAFSSTAPVASPVISAATGLKPSAVHVCPYPGCGKAFVARQALVRHTQVHTGQRPYACSYCGNRFRCASHLKRHQRQHTNTRPYTCPTCSKAYIDHTNLIRHAVLHHDARPYACGWPNCKAAYTMERALREHILNVHGLCPLRANGHAQRTFSEVGYVSLKPTATINEPFENKRQLQAKESLNNNSDRESLKTAGQSHKEHGRISQIKNKVTWTEAAESDKKQTEDDDHEYNMERHDDRDHESNYDDLDHGDEESESKGHEAESDDGQVGDKHAIARTEDHEEFHQSGRRHHLSNTHHPPSIFFGRHRSKGAAGGFPKAQLPSSGEVNESLSDTGSDSGDYSDDVCAAEEHAQSSENQTKSVGSFPYQRGKKSDYASAQVDNSNVSALDGGVIHDHQKAQNATLDLEKGRQSTSIAKNAEQGPCLRRARLNESHESLDVSQPSCDAGYASRTSSGTYSRARFLNGAIDAANAPAPLKTGTSVSTTTACNPCGDKSAPDSQPVAYDSFKAPPKLNPRSRQRALTLAPATLSTSLAPSPLVYGPEARLNNFAPTDPPYLEKNCMSASDISQLSAHAIAQSESMTVSANGFQTLSSTLQNSSKEIASKRGVENSQHATISIPSSLSSSLVTYNQEPPQQYSSAMSGSAGHVIPHQTFSTFMGQSVVPLRSRGDSAPPALQYVSPSGAPTGTLVYSVPPGAISPQAHLASVAKSPVHTLSSAPLAAFNPGLLLPYAGSLVSCPTSVNLSSSNLAASGASSSQNRLPSQAQTIPSSPSSVISKSTSGTTGFSAALPKIADSVALQTPVRPLMHVSNLLATPYGYIAQGQGAWHPYQMPLHSPGQLQAQGAYPMSGLQQEQQQQALQLSPSASPLSVPLQSVCPTMMGRFPYNAGAPFAHQQTAMPVQSPLPAYPGVVGPVALYSWPTNAPTMIDGNSGGVVVPTMNVMQFPPQVFQKGEGTLGMATYNGGTNGNGNTTSFHNLGYLPTAATTGMCDTCSINL